MPLGHHVRKDGMKFPQAIEFAITKAKKSDIKTECCQIFAVGPANSRVNISDAEKTGIKEADIDVYVHSSYLSNPWSKRSHFGVILVKQELKLCQEIGAKGLVVHLQRQPPNIIAKVIADILLSDQTPKEPIIYLEVESYKSCETTYETPEKICALFAEIKKLGVEHRVGLCIDTAHLWAAGVDISSYQDCMTWLTQTQDITDNLMVHFNDQIWALGQGRDEHAPLGYGTIWGKYNSDSTDKPMEKSGLVAVLDWATEKNCPIILERKPDRPKINSKPSGDNIDSDYELIAKLGYFKDE